MLISTAAMAASDWTIQQSAQPFSATLTATGAAGASMIARCDDQHATLTLRLSNHVHPALGSQAMLSIKWGDGLQGDTIASANRPDPQTMLVTIEKRNLVLVELDLMWELQGPFTLAGSGLVGSGVYYGSDDFSSANEAAIIESFAKICDLTRGTIFNLDPPFQR